MDVEVCLAKNHCTILVGEWVGNLVKVPRPIYGRVCVGQCLLPTMPELPNKARIGLVHDSTVRANMSHELG